MKIARTFISCHYRVLPATPLYCHARQRHHDNVIPPCYRYEIRTLSSAKPGFKLREHSFHQEYTTVEKSNINISHIMREVQRKVKLNESESECESKDYWVERRVSSMGELYRVYMALSKSRLTLLVVFTGVAGYAFAPLHPSITVLGALSLGTFLCSAAANTFNQVMEVPYDSQMDRCKERVLVRQHLITPLHAVGYGVGAAVSGVVLLATLVNPLTALLGLGNIVLYSGIYTTLKRYTILNTWIGSIVGAIPPAMGWAAATGSLDWGALALCALLYFWQFPHFNSLSYNIRGDYCRAGYHMMSVVSPRLNTLVSLRNTAALIPLCMVIPFTGISHCSFSFYSLLINAYFTYLAWRFHSQPNKQTARDLFRFSLVYLPILFGSLAIGYAFKERSTTVTPHHGDESHYLRDLCPVPLAGSSANERSG